MLEELLVVGEDNDLPIGESVGEKLGKSSAVLDVKAVNHIVQYQEAELRVEFSRHGEKERNCQRIQM